MSGKLAEALFDFKGKVGTSFWKTPTGLLHAGANRLIANLASPTGAYTAESPKISHNILKARTSFVEDGANQYFEDIAAEPMNPVPLNNGFENLVFDCNNGYVLKMKTGDALHHTKSELVLSPVESDYSQSLDVYYEIAPKAKRKQVKPMAIMGMILKCAAEGVAITDPNPHNFGLRENGDKDILMVIDGGAAKRIENTHDVLVIAKSLAVTPLSGIYNSVPFLHPLWRGFKSSVKEMLGISHKAPQSPYDRPVAFPANVGN